MRCCENCFGYDFLTKHIEVESEDTGNCSFCPTQNTKLIAPSTLADLFSPLIDLYAKEEKGGLSLIFLLRSDWELFENVSEEKAREVLKYVFENQNYEFDNYKPVLDPDKSELSNWHEFKEELKHDNRYFPKTFPKQEDLSSLLSYLSIRTGETLNTLYRARLNADATTPYIIENMGSPPPELASGGRANPVGIAYLYVASTIKTALSEIRPHKSDLLTIAEFKLTESIGLIDLRSPRITVSPFRYSERELKNIHKGLGLLVSLGEELTKPVSQNKAQLEYLSSQYLCEFIKSEGYEGVVYKSALGDGDNYAIFDESKLKGDRTSLYKVEGVDIEFESVDLPPTILEQTPSNPKKMKGTVKWFNDDKGFGFITCKNKVDVFVHAASIIDSNQRKTLTAKQGVEFLLGKNKKGICAREVILIDES